MSARSARLKYMHANERRLHNALADARRPSRPQQLADALGEACWQAHPEAEPEAAPTDRRGGIRMTTPSVPFEYRDHYSRHVDLVDTVATIVTPPRQWVELRDRYDAFLDFDAAPQRDRRCPGAQGVGDRELAGQGRHHRRGAQRVLPQTRGELRQGRIRELRQGRGGIRPCCGRIHHRRHPANPDNGLAVCRPQPSRVSSSKRT
jgi:hypothetical protein